MISKIVFFGDSITAANCNVQNLLGNGFVSILKDMFSSDIQLKNIQFVNSGVNGHIVQDLMKRYDLDVVNHQPDAVVIKIGINDAYNDFMAGNDNGQIKNYELGLQRLIGKLLKRLPHTQLFLFTPYLISDSKFEAFYLKMSEYCGVVKGLGEYFDIPVLDVQSIFDTAVKLKPAREWADDQIHPHRDGHAHIARAAFPFLKGHLLES